MAVRWNGSAGPAMVAGLMTVQMAAVVAGGAGMVLAGNQAGRDPAGALLVAEDLPAGMTGQGVTHEPQFDYDTASFMEHGGLDAVSQVWTAEVTGTEPVVIVFDFRFLFPDAAAAEAYLEAAEPVLSESITGLELQADTPTIGESLRHYAGSLSQSGVTIDVHNFLLRVGPVAAKVFVSGFGTTLDDGMAIAQAAGARIESWLLAPSVPASAAPASAAPSAGPSSPPASMPAGAGLRQWAIDARASSEYGSDSWSALRATGEPDVEVYSDDTDAWAPASESGTREWLELTYGRAVVPAGIGIVESLGNGAVVLVEAWDPGAGAWVELWSGSDPTPDGEVATFRPPLEPVGFATDRIRVTLDTDIPGWNEIDAVELVGTVL